MDQLSSALSTKKPAEGVGPMAALKRVRFDCMDLQAKLRWIEEARLDAILGGMKLSMSSLRSGLRCYVAFVGKSLPVW